MAIEISNLQKTYIAKGNPDVPALKGVSFTLPEKGMVFILGKSGCGKSTLLNVLGGLDGFDNGDVIIDGKSMKNFSARDLDRYRNDSVGFVFQENNLLDEYTVARNVGLSIELQNGKDGGDKVATALNAVDLLDFGERKCNRLSGGQKQRVAIARAIVKNPGILLCDEPTGSLDSETGEDIFNLLKKISESTLVVVVSHDRESAEKFGDRIIEIKDGAVISDSEKTVESTAITETENKAEEEKNHGGLPAKRALSIGAGFLIARPVRLALCIIICLLTFICVGVSDTFASYDRQKVVVDNYSLYDTPYYIFTRTYTYDLDEDGYEFTCPKLAFNNNEYERLKTLVKSDRLDKLYNCRLGQYDSQLFFGCEINEAVGKYYVEFSGIAELDESMVADYGFTLYGDYPKNEGEIIISKYLFEGFKSIGYTPDKDNPQVKEEISEYSDIIGKTISHTYDISYKNSYDLELKVVGVIDTNVNTDIYDKVIYKDVDDTIYQPLIDANNEMCFYGLQMALFAPVGYYENIFLPKMTELNYNKVDNENYIKSVVAPIKSGKKTLIKNSRIHEKYHTESDENGKSEYYILTGDACAIADDQDEQMGFLKIVFFFVALGLSVIAVLFILYFTMGVVTEKKREVGILRAIGASRGDIFKIFAAENGIFAAGIIALSTVFAAIADVIANAALTKGFGVKAALVSFSLRQFGVIAAVAILAILLGMIIPVVKMLCAKPVDIISGRK